MGEIERMMRRYYQEYYKKSLGLPDWAERVDARLKEEESYCLRFIQWIETWFDYSFRGKKVLVCGCGTGGEVVNFWRKGATVYAIDSNNDATKIAKRKSATRCQNEPQIENGCIEKLPFSSNDFDFIYCSTVLEHVDNVEDAVSEMIRCVKPSGRIFIECPDYRQWYEPHYKMSLPMFMPKIVNKAILFACRRPVKFFGTLNLVNSRKLTNIFMNHPVTSFRVLHPWPCHWQQNISLRFRLIKIITTLFEVHRDQFWILQKLDQQT